MSHYQTILCAVDLSDESAIIIKKAMRLAGDDPERVQVIHACEHPITGYGEITGKNHVITEAQIRQQAYPLLCQILETVGLDVGQGHIVFGRPADAVHELAKTLGADLIVTGSHGKAGIQLLLGSTANSILHGAECDVLTIRVGGD